jgi:hypothetical protein
VPLGKLPFNAPSIKKIKIKFSTVDFTRILAIEVRVCCTLEWLDT